MKTTLIGIFLSFVSFSVFADDVYFHVVMDSSLTLDHAQVCAESVCQLANASGAEGYCEAFSDVKLVITKNLSTEGIEAVGQLECVDSVNVTPPR